MNTMSHKTNYRIAKENLLYRTGNYLVFHGELNGEKIYKRRDIYFPGGSVSKESACSAGNTGDVGLILGRKDPLEEGVASYSSILAWTIPWTDGLQSIGSQRAGFS